MFRMKLSTSMMAIVVALAMTQSAQGQLIVGRGTDANEVYHLDIGTSATTPLFNLTANGITFGSGVEGLDVDDAGRTIYLITGSGSPLAEVLYTAHYDDRDFNDPTRLRVRKKADITYAGTAPRLSGLAHSSTNGKLYACYEFGAAGVAEGIYEIDTTTGALTLVMDFTPQAASIQLSGLAHNPVNNLLYATNNQTGVTNLLLNSIDLTLPPASARVAIPNSTLVATDEGLAIANNKAYILNSNAGPSIKVFDLASGTFDAPIVVGGWTGTDNAAGAGWGPNALVVPAGSNLGTTISASPTTALEYPVGTQINYTVKFANFGPANATNVNYSIVLSGTAAATISNIVGGNAVEGPTGTITGSESTFVSGQQFTVSFTATTTGAGVLTATASIPPGSNSDAYLGNNVEDLSHVIRVYPAIDLEFTSVNSSPKSNVPGGFQVETTTAAGTERFRKPSGSPKGDYVALQIDTNAATAQDFIYVRRDASNTWSTVVQEGVTTVSTGNQVAIPGTGRMLALLDDGRFGYTIDTNAATANDEMTVVYSDPNHNVVAREATLIPVLTGLGIGYGATQDSVNLTGDGKFSLRMSSLTGTSSPNNIGIVADSGNRLIARSGSTIPGNQLGGGTSAISLLTADSFYMDCTGSTYLYEGSLTGSVPIVVVDGNVVFQAGGTVSGFNGTLAASWSTTAGIISTQMYSNGEWWCRGTTSDTTQDFVLKGFGGSYTTVAKRGDPIYTGAGENWSDVDGFGPTFFGYAANRQGSYVLTGRTDNPNTSKNAVAVANGTTELFREGDRVDLDNNGLLDDDAFIDTFVVDMQLLTDAGDYYAVVNLRSASAFIGKALVHIANVGAPPATGADITVTKTVSDNSLEALGEQTVFKVTVCNKGPMDATNVVMTDPLPAGLDFVSATNGAAETAPNSNIVTATVAAMPACTCQSYDITVQAVSVGNFNNTASATADQADANLANNSASAAVEVTAIADLSVTKIDNGGAPVGGQFIYTITITNNGPAPATNVLMTDNLDPTTTFVSATNGATQSSPGVVTRTFTSIANGASEVVTITVTGTVQTIVTNQVTVSGAETDPNSNNNTAFVETIVGDVADMSITISNPGLQLIGQDYSYTLTIFNGGPTTATNVQVTATLPAGLSFVSATNGAIENPGGSGNIEASFASIASQASEMIILTVNAPAAGTFLVSASVSADQVDSDDLNNDVQILTRVGNFRQVRPIYTQIAGHPTATVPGLLDGGDQPVFGEFDQMLNINVSQDGTRWTMEGGSNLATAIDGVMMVGSGFTGTVFGQEGKQAFGAPAGTLYTFFDDDVGFNSNNDFAWGALTSVTANSDITYTNVGGVNAHISQTGTPVNGLQSGSGTIANSTVSQHLLNDGRVGFNMSNISGSRAALGYWDSVSGINVFVERNVTSIDGDLITGLPVDRIFFTTPNALHTLFRATISGGSMLVYDGSRVLRTGDALPDASGTINAVNDCHMSNNGSWIARGDKPGGDDWVIRNGAMVAATGQSIEGGAEMWGNAIGTVRVNDNGDYLVVGNTNIGDPLLDNVIVVNGDVVVRESDPVDLNGNGLFDDDIYITSFTGTGNVWLSNDLKIHFLANLRNGEGTNLSTAFLVVDLAGCTTILGDANGNATRNGRDVQAFVNCLLLGDLTHPCKCADMDNDGDIDSADATLFATALVGDP